MFFGSLSSGLSHKTKFVAWQCVAQAVNEVGGQQRSLKDVKKMVWLEITFIFFLLTIIKITTRNNRNNVVVVVVVVVVVIIKQ